MAKKNRGKHANPQTTRASDESVGLLRFVQELMKDRQFPEALRAAQTLIEKDPLNPLSHAVMGGLLLQMNQPHEAIRRFEMAVHFGMDRNAEVLRSLAITNTLSGYPFLGAQTARACLALDLSEEQRALCVTIVTAAENLLPDLIGKHPIDPETAERAAILVEQTNRALYNEDFDRAKSRALEATKAAPAWPFVWTNLASLLFGEGDVAGAIDAVLEGERLATIPDSATGILLVRLYSVVGRQAEAESLANAMIADPAAHGAEEED
ncbi:MAG: tetratricopeptide repeat protein, partial [Chloroflexota bacterium]